MGWHFIQKFCAWPRKRKDLVVGLVGVAVDEVAKLVPGAGLACKILGEFAKHGARQLCDPETGKAYPAEQLDQINAWLEKLETSYAGLLDRLEALPLTLPDNVAELTALVRTTLEGQADLAAQFDACVVQVRLHTLSLCRIEEKIDHLIHVVHHLPLSTEDFKAQLAAAPLTAEWAQFRRLRPEVVQAVAQAEDLFLAQKADDAVALYVRLLAQRGVGRATLAHHAAVACLTHGRLADAHRCLEQSIADGPAPAAAMIPGLATLSLAWTRGERLPVWRSLPRGLVVDRRYRIEAEVARGGMASVYKAVGVDPINRDQVVALKVPAPALMADETTRQRFVQEIQVSQHLSRGAPPSIVQTLGYVHFDDPHTQRPLYGLVMEFVDGLNLAHYLAQRQAKNKPLTPAEILAVLKPVCEALAYAHGPPRPVLHRDLKPHNIMLLRGRGAKLMDFGIARVLEEGQAMRAGEVVGTPAYLPPEFLDPALPSDVRSDVYLAGNLLLELLTFRPRGILAKHRPDCPPAWAAFVHDAMQPDPEERPGTIAEFWKWLQHRESPAPVAPVAKLLVGPTADPVTDYPRWKKQVDEQKAQAVRAAEVFDYARAVAILEAVPMKQRE